MGVHEGHAFIVEAAVSVGGKSIKPGLNIHRFANRIPLLFEVGGEGILYVGAGAVLLPSALPHPALRCPPAPPRPPAVPGRRAGRTW